MGEGSSWSQRVYLMGVSGRGLELSGIKKSLNLKKKWERLKY